MRCNSSLALLALLAAGTSYAADIHVSATAPEGGKGTVEAPYATLAEAVASAAPGDVILLSAGEYKFVAPKKPFEGKLVTVKPAADAAGKVIVANFNAKKLAYMRFEGLKIPQEFRMIDAKWVQFVRCHFYTDTFSHWGTSFLNSDHVGLYGCKIATKSSSQVSMAGITNAEFRYNDISNGTSDAFQMNGDTILVEGNYIHDITPSEKAHPDGIQLANTRNLTIRGNVFDCHNMQTFFFSWTAKETVYENFLVENNVCTTARYHGLTTHPSTDMVVRNNLFIPHAKHPDGSASINLKNMQGKLTVQNNIFWQFSVEPRDKDAVGHNIYMQKNWKYGTPGEKPILAKTDDVFIDRAAYDYRLKAGSPAIGAAKPGTAPDTDILGRKRDPNKPSIGPIEPQKDDKPFMEMWKAHFAKMQAEVTPPEPKE